MKGFKRKCQEEEVCVNERVGERELVEERVCDCVFSYQNGRGKSLLFASFHYLKK